MSDSYKTNLSKAHSQLKIIWMAMLGSVGMFVAVALLISTSNPLAGMDPGVVTVLQLAMVFTAALNIGLAIFMDRMLKSPDKITNFLSGHSDMEKATNQPSVDNPTSLDELAMSISPYYTQTCIIRWALCESIAVFGLVLSFAVGVTLLVGGFMAVAAGTLIKFGPSLEEHYEMARSVKRGR